MASLHLHTAEHHIENSTPDIWNEVELPSLRIMDDTRFTNLFAMTSSGWLQSGADSLLWLPLERRGKVVESFGRRVVIGGQTGAMTILELPGEQDHSLYSMTECGAEDYRLQLDRMLRRKEHISCCLLQGKPETSYLGRFFPTYTRSNVLHCFALQRARAKKVFSCFALVRSVVYHGLSRQKAACESKS
jgi:hypothetical protein